MLHVYAISFSGKSTGITYITKSFVSIYLTWFIIMVTVISVFYYIFLIQNKYRMVQALSHFKKDNNILVMKY